MSEQEAEVASKLSELLVVVVFVELSKLSESGADVAAKLTKLLAGCCCYINQVELIQSCCSSLVGRIKSRGSSSEQSKSSKITLISV
jgi:hypothetical protein